MKNSILGLLFICLSLGTASAQWEWASSSRLVVGGQLGLSFSIGTHQNRIGLIAKVFAHYDFLQINAQVLGAYNFQSWATKRKGWELQARAGIVGAWGRRDSFVNPYLNEISNQTGRRYSVGYAFNMYRDGFKTNQVAGTFGFQVRGFRFVMENDFLSFIAQDRYRTGSAGIYYWFRPTNTQFGIHSITWTGDPYAKDVPWVRDSLFPSRFGYIDTYNAPFGQFSVGIAGIEVEQILPYFQYAHLAIGVDAEQIRNAMQNKLIHDSPILPANWGENDEGKNPHIPMICVDGKCYLYQPDQRIRPARFYLQARGNSTLFY
jgi:hypothetical protein